MDGRDVLYFLKKYTLYYFNFISFIYLFIYFLLFFGY